MEQIIIHTSNKRGKIMAKMRSVYFLEKDSIGIKSVDVPQMKPGQVKVKTAYAAICATDIHMVTQGLLGARPGIPLGHEASGIIEEITAEAALSGLKKGDKVVFFPLAPCGVCENCKSGKSQYCGNGPHIAAFSDYIVTDSSAVFKIPDNADLKHAALIEPMVCTIRAMDIANVKHGDRVALSGAGGIGSILLNMIILSGASKITVIEPVEEKRKMALSMGAEYVIDPFTEDITRRSMEITDSKGFDHVFEVSGSPKAAQPALDIVGACGKVIYFAVYPPEYTLPLNLYNLYMKEASIHTVFTNPDLFPRAIDLMTRVQMDKIIGKILPLDQIIEAVDLFHQSRYPKILLDCQ